MKTMVLGVEAVGSVAAEILASSGEFDQIVLVDMILERTKRVERKISNDKVAAERVDALDVDGMTKMFKGMDLVLNGVIPRFNLGIMEACLKAGSSYADMAWDIALDTTKAEEVIEEPPAWHQLRTDAEFKKANLTAMMGLGCDPGLSNIFARMAADKLDRVKEILVRDGDNEIVEGHKFAPL
ncbi:MAG: saccharopine dehydrogenase family protein [Thermoplasmata archaeon]